MQRTGRITEPTVHLIIIWIHHIPVLRNNVDHKDILNKNIFYQQVLILSFKYRHSNLQQQIKIPKFVTVHY